MVIAATTIATTTIATRKMARWSLAGAKLISVGYSVSEK
jgi:hypothetical protein